MVLAYPGPTERNTRGESADRTHDAAPDFGDDIPTGPVARTTMAKVAL